MEGNGTLKLLLDRWTECGYQPKRDRRMESNSNRVYRGPCPTGEGHRLVMTARKGSVIGFQCEHELEAPSDVLKALRLTPEVLGFRLEEQNGFETLVPCEVKESEEAESEEREDEEDNGGTVKSETEEKIAAELRLLRYNPQGGEFGKQFGLYVQTPAALNHTNLGPFARAVYVTLCRFRNRKTNTACVGLRRLAQESNMDKNTVVRSIKELLAAGVIEKADRGGSGRGDTSAYRIVPPKRWPKALWQEVEANLRTIRAPEKRPKHLPKRQPVSVAQSDT